MKPITEFLKLAWPCLETLVQTGACSESEFKQIEDAILNDSGYSEERIAELFPVAYGHMERRANKIGKDVWSKEVVEGFWFEDHKSLLESKDKSYKKMEGIQREDCIPYKATVIINQGNYLRVQREDGSEKTVLSKWVPNSKKGDKIWIHQGYGAIKI